MAGKAPLAWLLPGSKEYRKKSAMQSTQQVGFIRVGGATGTSWAFKKGAKLGFL